MDRKSWIILVVLFLLSLVDYKIAKLLQILILHFLPRFSYAWAITIPWIAAGFLLSLLNPKVYGLNFDHVIVRKNWKELGLTVGLVIGGLIVFILLGITKYFHAVQYPLVFFIVTPIAEELLFRGVIYGWVEKTKIGSSVLVSSIFFALHHLQYFNYHLTMFAIFQVGYTFGLGILLGKIRQKSGSLYLSTGVHMLINFVTTYW